MPTHHDWPLSVGEADTESFDNGKIEVYSLASGERKVLVEGGSFGRFLPPDRLLYGRRGRLFAVGFDVERLELTGTPEPVVDDLLTSPVFGSSQFDVAANGTLAYMAGSPDLFNSRVVEVSRTGELTELPLPPSPYRMNSSSRPAAAPRSPGCLRVPMPPSAPRTRRWTGSSARSDAG